MFVHPSWAESFPYAILEAMALALPIVASDVGGIGEAITHGVSGLLVPPADATALAGAIASLLADPARAGRFGALARQEVERRFTVDRMVDGVLAVYDEVEPRRRSVHTPTASSRSFTRLSNAKRRRPPYTTG